ncbi:hypothetical protein [Halobacteriovorax sp.]|uniref:hypothetical protein n=1 Tax=Halobacteriovorax sp. TaxID=2020862 RepID=UPI0035679A7A
MFNYLLATFFILSFSLAGTLETIDCHDEVNIENSESISISLSAVNHEHQGEEDCEDRSGHCSHHCSGIHNLLQFSSSVVLSNRAINHLTFNWYYDNHYIEPFLDSALKPPLFS